jgi:hypothetical protein
VSRPTGFKELCVKTAKNFLQTVVVVDDQAAFYSEERHTGAVLEAPTPGTVPAVEEPDGPDPAEPATRRALDAKPLIDAFASEGLVCAILQPLPPDQESGVLAGRFEASTRRSDIVVLDWMLNDDDGRTALDLIEQLVSDDLRSQGRLRLIAVYTGERDLDAVQAAVKERIGAADEDCSRAGSTDVWIRRGRLRIVFYLKDSRQPAPGQSGTSLSVVDLPQRLVDQFAELTCGLIANIALASLAAVRENAHHLLSKFVAEMDAPFLSHRAIVDQFEDAEEFAVALIGHELRAILDAAEVGTLVDTEHVEEWTAEQDGSRQRHLRVDEVDVPVTWDWVQSLLEKGRNAAGPPPRNQGQQIGARKYRELKTLTRLFTQDAQQAADADHTFARLSSLARNIPEPLPMRVGPVVTLGTILASVDGTSPEGERATITDATSDSTDSEDIKGSTNTYWLCLQPRCDSVRITGWRKFPLARLKAVDERTRFDLVARGLEGERLYLQLVWKHYEMTMPEFEAGQDGMVRAPLDEEGRPSLIVDKESRRFHWLAELRYAQAQHMVERFANTLSRVGFDEYEWLRLSALER